MIVHGLCNRCSNEYPMHRESPGGYCSAGCRLAAEREARDARANDCRSCGGPLVANGVRRDVYCSDACEQGSRNPWVVFERDDFSCVYCGRSSIEDGVKLHADHIVPKAAGGTDSLRNLITACSGCNCAKGGSRLSEDIEGRVLALAESRTTRDALVRVP